MNYVFSDKVSGLQASAIREILKFCAFPDVISFAAGNPAPEAFPTKVLAELSDSVMQTDPILALQYNITEGYTPLRDALKRWMGSRHCFEAGADDLIITSGAQQANELACKVLCNEGDTLICESPSFIGSLNAFRSYHVNLVGMEMEEDGIRLDLLEQALKDAKKAKLIYLIPNFQNPTGRTMSWEKRKAVYALAQKYNAVILEDNPYGDLRFAGEDIPAIKTLDTDGRVIYTGTFSKILAPGLRVGYVSAAEPIIQKIIVCKQVADVHTNIWAQVLCERFLATQNIEQHLAELQKIYRHKCNLMLEGMEQHFSRKITWTKPEGGLFIWATLPQGSDMMGFCKRAVSEYKIAVVPGTAFSIRENDPSDSFRLNFSTPTDEQIVRGIEILGNMTRELLDK